MEDNRKEQTQRKCPSCGSNLTYNPETSSLFCEHCGTEEHIDSIATSETDISLLEKDLESWSEETVSYRCPNCGAVDIVSKTELSHTCSFCGTPNSTKVAEDNVKKPQAVQPFKVDKNSALKNAWEWARKSFWSPKKFKQEITTKFLNGLYYPVFTFDSDTETYYRGTLGRTETYRDSKGNMQTRTVYFNISGVLNRNFDELTIQASNFIAQKYVDKLLPFETNGAFAYNDDYLLGFSASQYTKDGPTCKKEANGVMEAKIKSAILSKYTYSTIKSYYQQVKYYNETFKYVLIPIWVGHYYWKAKNYNYFINGVNGKITGHRPVSAVKVLLAVLIGLIILTGIALLVYFFVIK